jgi:general stress protein 26
MIEAGNLLRKEAAAKIKELVRSASICMFTTTIQQWPLHLRSLGAQDVDDEGNIWFIAPRNSEVNAIPDNGYVQVFYSNARRSEFLSLTGKATLEHDPDKVHKLSNPLATIWSPGEEDPHINLIRIAPEEAYYWDNACSEMVAV